MAFAAVAAMPALATVTVNKQFTPATIDPGDTSVLRISFFNSSLVPLTAAAVTDNLPAQIAIANPPGVNDTCGFSSITATAGAQRITTEGGTIPAGSGVADGACFIEVNVVSTSAGNWLNTIPANGPSNGFVPGGTTSGFQATENAATVTNTTAATATLSVRGLSRLTGSKTFAPSPGLVGEPITLAITLTNPNALSTIPLTTFTDTLPAGMTVATTPAESVSCTGTGAVNGTVTAVAGAGSVTLTGGTIGGGGTCVISVQVVVASIAGTTQTFANAVPANAIGNTRGLGSAAFNRSEVVNTPIGVAKAFVTASGGNTAIANPIPVNQEFWLRVDITNASTQTPIDITTFTDTFPAGMQVGTSTPTLDCVTNGGGTNGSISATPGDGSFTLTGGSVGITGSPRRCRMYVPVVLTTAGSFTNNIAANAVGNSAGFTSPAASATANANAELTVTKTASPANVAPGQPTTFTITLRNFSGGPVTGVTLTDALPMVGGNQMVISSPNNFSTTAGCVGGTFGNASGSSSLTWTGGTITGGAGLNPGVCTIRFNANTPPGTPTGTTFTNTIPVGGVTGTGGSGGVGNTNASSANVLMVAAASVTKAFSPATVVQGGTSTLIVTLSNQSGATLTNAALTDNLPSGVVIAPVPNASTTCAGGSVSALAGASSFSLSGATVPTTGCTFRASVVAQTTGTHVNSIPAGALTNDQGATNPANANATLTVTSGLTATKTFNPTSVANGGVSQVTIRVNNVSGTPYTNLSISDGPMTNLAVATPAAASTTCAGSPLITAVPGTSTVTMSGATLAAGANCELLFNVKTSGNPASWPNNLPIGAITTAEGAQNTTAVNATLGRLTTVSIGINKSFNPVSVSAGQPSLLQIDLVNPVASPSTVHNVSVTDNFPSGMEVYAVPNVSTTCTNATVTALPGSATVSISGATIPVGNTCSVFLRVTSTKFLNLTNTIPAGAVTSTEGLTNALPTSATLSTLQGLGVTKAFSPTSVSLGQVSTMQLRLISTLDPTAPAPVTLHNVSFSDTLPAGLSVAPAPNTSTTCTGGTVTAAAGSGVVTVSGMSLPPGSNCFVYVDVLASALGAYTNTIPSGAVTSTEGYSNASPASAVLNVLPPPTVTKSFSPASVLPGAVSTATIVIHNNSATLTLHNVAYVDTLPSGLAVAPTPNATASCGGGSVSAPASGSTISLTNGVIAPGADCTVQVDVRSNSPGSYTNTIAAGSIATAEGVTNPTPASGTLGVLGPPNVGKSFTPNVIGAGATSRLSIQLGNPNAVAATLTSALVDTLPANVAVAAAPNIGGTCALAAVTAAAGASTVSYASGATIPAGGCTIDVDVTSSVVGTYVNAIPANALSTDLGNNASDTSAQLDVLALPTLAKDIAPATIAAGGTSTLTLTLGNTNAVPITLASAFTDSMPIGVTTQGGNTGTCTGVTVSAASLGMASGTQIPAGGCTIVVTVTSSTPGTVTNTTGTLSTNAGDAAPASAPLTVSAPPSLAKSIAPGTIAVNGSATLTLTLGNPNRVAIALSGAFSDAMPGGVTTTGGNTGTCADVTVTPTAITMASGAAVPAGGCTIVVTITSSTPGTVTNTTSALTTSVGTAPAASAPLTVTADAPTLAKSIAPATIGAGGTATLTIAIGNSNAVPMTLTSAFSDTMPSGIVVAGTHSGTCPGVTVSTLAVSIAAGTAIAPGGCTIVVPITSTAPGSATNTTSGLVTAFGTAPPASAPITVVASTVSLAKSIAPASIAAGGSAKLTITIGNASGTAVTLTSAFTDTMPAGVTTTSANTGTCGAVGVTPTAITMASGATVPAGGCTIVVTITSSTPGTVVNTTGSLATSAGTAPPASAPLGVTAPGPTLAKTIAPATIAAGGTATLTLALGNTGTVALTLTADFVDTMPAGVTTTSGNTGTCGGVTVAPKTILMAGASTIPPGGCTIVVTITSSTPGTVTNTTGSVTTNGGTAPPASAPITVTATSGPTLAKTISPPSIAPGGNATLTLTLGNAGSKALALTSPFVDTMPAGVTTTGGNTGTCSGVTVTPTTITMASGSAIPPGGCTIAVTVTSSTPGTVINTTGPLATDAGSAPPASAPITVQSSGTASLVKTIVPGSIAAGGAATLTITLGNSGSTALTLTAAFTDPMPAGMTTTGGNAGTCTNVQVTPTLITMPAGSTIPPGGCTIVVGVTSSTEGSVVNVTSTLVAGSVVAPAASAPLAVTSPAAPGQPIPVDSRFALLALGLAIALVAAWRLRTR